MGEFSISYGGKPPCKGMGAADIVFPTLEHHA